MEELESKALSALKRSKKPLKLREIAKLLNIQKREKLKIVLKDLVSKGKIVKLKGATYTLAERVNMVVGKLCVFREGFGFVDPLEGGKGVFVPRRNMAGAMNGDIVTAVISKEEKDGKREGRIVSILKRAITKVVGRIEKLGKRYVVVPEDKRIRYNLTLKDAEGVNEGDYVVANIVSYPTNRRGAIGKVVENLGQKGPKLDIEIIIRNYSIRTNFPDEVIQEANTIPETVTEEEIKGRVDLRDQLNSLTYDYPMKYLYQDD
jgi:ribonuclease R